MRRSRRGSFSEKMGNKACIDRHIEHRAKHALALSCGQSAPARQIAPACVLPLVVSNAGSICNSL